MIGGMTGTSRGMTEAQRRKAKLLFIRYELDTLRHGDCVGADEQCHNIAVRLGISIIVHPPKDPKLRAFCKTGDIKILKAKPYLDRNKDIVIGSKIVFAFPREMSEVLRSGTWATIRYAKKIGKKLIIVYPDGSVEKYNK